MAFEIAKSGWLQRQSTVLKRWKRSWVVLYQDGNLKYFTDPNSCVAEEATFLPSLCTGYTFGKMVNYVDPPAGYEKSCLFQVHLQFGEAWTFCADTTDDLTAWQMSLEQYRRAVSVPPVGQGIVYTNGASYCSPVGTVQTTTTYRPGSTTVISNGGGYYGGGYPGHVIAAPGQSVVVPGAAGTSYVAQSNGLAYGGNTIVVQQPTTHCYRPWWWY